MQFSSFCTKEVIRMWNALYFVLTNPNQNTKYRSEDWKTWKIFFWPKTDCGQFWIRSSQFVSIALQIRTITEKICTKKEEILRTTVYIEPFWLRSEFFWRDEKIIAACKKEKKVKLSQFVRSCFSVFVAEFMLQQLLLLVVVVLMLMLVWVQLLFHPHILCASWFVQFKLYIGILD